VTDTDPDSRDAADESYDADAEARDTDIAADPRRHRRFLALLLAGLAPWVVLIAPSGRDVFFAWGWINVEGWHVFHLYEYLFEFTRGPRALPRRLQAWPIATALYAGALASALCGVLFGREDRRVTAGLAVFAMLSLLQFAAGFTGTRVSGLRRQSQANCAWPSASSSSL